MLSLKLILDKRRCKKDMTYPLAFSISVNRETRYIPTGFTVQEKYWSEKYHELKTAAPAYDAITNRIHELKEKYLLRIIEYEKKYPENITAQALREYMLTEPKPKLTVADFWSQEVRLLNKSGKAGNAGIYDETLVALKKVCNLEVSFDHVNYKFLNTLEVQLISNGLKINTVGIYLRTLRAVYNKAIKAEEAQYALYPFRNFKIRKELIRPRTLSLNELRQYFNAKVDNTSYLYESWLMGKLMLMLIGINFKDMALMNDSHIQHGRLIFNRAKTNRQYSIKLLPAALEILDYFRGRSNKILLGKIREADIDNKKKLRATLLQANKLFNKHIGLIGKELEIKEKLTGYCFRYSWANIAKQLGYSKDLISEALGHCYGLRVTGIYLEAYDLEHIDKMNKAICYEVKKKPKKARK